MRYVAATVLAVLISALWVAFALLLMRTAAVPLWAPLLVGVALIWPTYGMACGIVHLLELAPPDDTPDDWFSV